MPTLKSISQLNEDQSQQAEPVADVVQSVITRFPYKEYGIAEDEGGNSVTITMPSGMRLRMLRKTIEYYGNIAALEQKSDFEASAGEIDKLGEDIKERTEKLKDLTQQFAHIEFKPEKYAFASYILNANDLTLADVKALYVAYANDTAESLDPKLAKTYAKAIEYGLSYYKFLVGMLAVMD